MEKINLQLCIPYEKCIYNCPYCIAKGKNHGYGFENLYEKNKNEYFDNLNTLLKSGNYKSVIVTGEADPTQNQPFIREVVTFIRKNQKNYGALTIEIQTKDSNCSWSDLDIDVAAYSVDNLKDFENLTKLKHPKAIIRPVIILTKFWTIERVEKVLSNSEDIFEQLTFKELQLSDSETINKWIEKNKFQNNEWLEKRLKEYRRTNEEVSIRFDRSCQTAEGRYEIFRSDGLRYDTWEQSESVDTKYIK